MKQELVELEKCKASTNKIVTCYSDTSIDNRVQIRQIEGGPSNRHELTKMTGKTTYMDQAKS